MSKSNKKKGELIMSNLKNKIKNFIAILVEIVDN